MAYSRQVEINASLINIVNEFMQQNQISATEMDAAINNVAVKIKDAMMQEYMAGVQELLAESHEHLSEQKQDIEERLDVLEEEVAK